MLDSMFTGNRAGGYGGGICSEENTLTVRDSTFYGNSAWGGGGLYSYYDTRTVQNNTFVANAALNLYSALCRMGCPLIQANVLPWVLLADERRMEIRL